MNGWHSMKLYTKENCTKKLAGILLARWYFFKLVERCLKRELRWFRGLFWYNLSYVNVQGNKFWIKRLFILWQELMAVVRQHLL